MSVVCVNMERVNQLLSSDLRKIADDCPLLIFVDGYLGLVPSMVGGRVSMLERECAAWFLILLLDIECNGKPISDWVLKQLCDDYVFVVILDGHVD